MGTIAPYSYGPQAKLERSEAAYDKQRSAMQVETYGTQPTLENLQWGIRPTKEIADKLTLRGNEIRKDVTHIGGRRVRIKTVDRFDHNPMDPYGDSWEHVPCFLTLDIVQGRIMRAEIKSELTHYTISK